MKPSFRAFATFGSSIVVTLIVTTTVAYSSAAQEKDWQFSPGNAWELNANGVTARIKTPINGSAQLPQPTVRDALLRCQVKWEAESPRHNFGFVLRSNKGSYLALRYYDQPQALELLDFQDGDWQRIGDRSGNIQTEPSRWYELEVASIGQDVWARLWLASDPVPDWQLRVLTDHTEAGDHGVLVHDAATIQFRHIKFHRDGEAFDGIRRTIENYRRNERLAVARTLQLAVAPHEFALPDKHNRQVDIVPFSANDRVPVNGTLTWTFAGKTHEKEITQADYQQLGLSVTIPVVDDASELYAKLVTEDGIELTNSCLIPPLGRKSWRTYVVACLDTLCEHGRDEYGPEQTPLFMAVLDTTTLRSPQHPLPLDALVRLEGRMHRRGERGSNLWYDQPLLLALKKASELTGQPRYQQAAEDYTRFFLTHCRKLQDGQNTYHTGLPAWGTHVYWNCFEERPDGDQDGSGPHEILVFRANWDDMFRLEPERTQRMADDVWTHHIVDKSTGYHNRHDDQSAGCDFAFSGGSFTHLFAAAYAATGEEHYLIKAKTVADWHWQNRDELTELPADCPGLADRYDGQHTFTTVCGPHAMLLLEAFRVSNDKHFYDLATTYIKQFDRFAWDETSGTYFAMLRLNGQPISEREKQSGYGAYAPTGHVNVWRTTFYSYEFTLSAAQAALLAYELSGETRDDRDQELLKIALRWAQVIENQMPAHTGRRWKDELEAAMPLTRQVGGAYAEDYGRAISFFVHLHRATDESHFLDLAEQLADDAVRKLYHHGLFKGHAAKPYYEVTNGVGLLLYALLELDEPEKPSLGAY